VKPNIIKFLIITNIAIFLISVGIIFFKITSPSQPTVISTKKPVAKEDKIVSPTLKSEEEKKEEVKNPEVSQPNLENVQKQTISKESPTQQIFSKKKLAQQQNKLSSSLAKTEIETAAGYMVKDTPPARNIKFVFFSRKAKKVSIIGDFNDWTPQPLTKVSENRWEITIKITSGQEYLYNFLVDGKVTVDPNNKKPPQISPQGFKSSVLSL
jgi:hypothetical protein